MSDQSSTENRSTDAHLSQEEVVDRMRDEKIVMLTAISPDGKLVSHPMTVQQVTDDGDSWLFIGLEGDQAEAIQAHPDINLAFSKLGSWLSVAGHAEYVEDRAKVDELWDDQVAAYFPGGKDDPNLGLLFVRGTSAQWWGEPGGPVRALAEMVKSRVTGDRVKGASGTTEL